MTSGRRLWAVQAFLNYLKSHFSYKTALPTSRWICVGHGNEIGIQFPSINAASIVQRIDVGIDWLICYKSANRCSVNQSLAMCRPCR